MVTSKLNLLRTLISTKGQCSLRRHEQCLERTGKTTSHSTRAAGATRLKPLIPLTFAPLRLEQASTATAIGRLMKLESTPQAPQRESPTLNDDLAIIGRIYCPPGARNNHIWESRISVLRLASFARKLIDAPGYGCVVVALQAIYPSHE